MTTRLRVYLAGPIRGCSDEQKTWWRDEAKQLLKRDFDFEDPTAWADDRVLSLEIPKLEACDILLANMWKESIGTTLGIVRARHQGKPVVLADPNRIHNAILLRLVGVDNHFHSLDEACKRVRELGSDFKDFVVLKRDGAEEDFSVKKVVQSIGLAAAKAGVADPAFEEQISSPVISRLRRDGGRFGLLESMAIRGAIFEPLGRMSSDPSRPIDLRSRAQAILDAWRQREDVKGAERTSEETQAQIAALQAERLELLKALQERDGQLQGAGAQAGAGSPAASQGFDGGS